jgi:hypothetical protein
LPTPIFPDAAPGIVVDPVLLAALLSIEDVGEVEALNAEESPNVCDPNPAAISAFLPD